MWRWGGATKRCLNVRQLCGDDAHRSQGRLAEVIDERALALPLSWNAAEQIVEPERR